MTDKTELKPADSDFRSEVVERMCSDFVYATGNPNIRARDMYHEMSIVYDGSPLVHYEGLVEALRAIKKHQGSLMGGNADKRISTTYFIADKALAALEGGE